MLMVIFIEMSRLSHLLSSLDICYTLEFVIIGVGCRPEIGCVILKM